MERKCFIKWMYAICIIFLAIGYILLFTNSWIESIDDVLEPLFSTTLLSDKGLNIAVSTACFFAVLGGYQALEKQTYSTDRNDQAGKPIKTINEPERRLYRALWYLWLAVASCGILQVELRAHWSCFTDSASQLFCVVVAVFALIAVGMVEYFNKESK